MMAPSTKHLRRGLAPVWHDVLVTRRDDDADGGLAAVFCMGHGTKQRALSWLPCSMCVPDNMADTSNRQVAVRVGDSVQPDDFAPNCMDFLRRCAYDNAPANQEFASFFLHLEPDEEFLSDSKWRNYWADGPGQRMYCTFVAGYMCNHIRPFGAEERLSLHENLPEVQGKVPWNSARRYAWKDLARQAAWVFFEFVKVAEITCPQGADKEQANAS